MKKFTMQDYIEEAPEQALYNVEHYNELTDSLYSYCNDKNINTIWLVASGSSYNSCHCARPFMKKCLSNEIKIITPYTFTYYEHDVKENDLVLVITQSGQSTNAIEALKKVQKLHCFSACLTGNIENDVKNYTDRVFDYGVKEELVGYVTKGVTTLCTFLMLFAIRMSNKTKYLADIQKAIEVNIEVKNKTYVFIEKHYKDFTSMNWSYCCGAGGCYGVTLEGALKIGETVHIPSYAYEIEEYIHGPNLQLTPKYTVFLFDTNDLASSRVEQVYLATKNVTDKTYIITNNEKFKNDDHALYISEKIDETMASLAYLPFVQLISYIVSRDLNSMKQHPLLKKFKEIAAAKTENFVNYDEDE